MTHETVDQMAQMVCHLLTVYLLFIIYSYHLQSEVFVEKVNVFL